MNSQYKLHTFFDTFNDAQLQSIYNLNQANTPEVGSLESMTHLKKLIELMKYSVIQLKKGSMI